MTGVEAPVASRIIRLVVYPLPLRGPNRTTCGQNRLAIDFFGRLVEAARGAHDTSDCHPWADAIAEAGRQAVDRRHLGVFPDPDDLFDTWARLVGDRKLLSKSNVPETDSCLWIGRSGQMRGLPLAVGIEESEPADWAVQVWVGGWDTNWESFGSSLAPGLGATPIPAGLVAGDMTAVVA